MKLKRSGRCPVTGGLTTRMGLAGFKDLCLRKRRARVGFIRSKYTRGEFRDPFNTIEYRRCAWCKGERRNWPGELALINIKLEEHMAKKDGGRCVICDAKTELKNARGCMMVCPTCHKIVGYVDNHLGRIAEAAKGLGKEAALAALLGVEGAAVDPADHAIAEAVRECFGRELSVEQLGLRCKEEAEKAARIEGELVQMRAWLEEAMRTLVAVLPHEDEGLDDTRSHADIMDLADRAARQIKDEAALLDALRETMKPAEGETLFLAATRMALAARAWAALMDRARDVGFAEIADGAPEIMAATYIMAVEEVMRERDRLKEELENANAAKANGEDDGRQLGEKVLDGVLLNWAREQMEGGKLSLYVVEAKGKPVAA